MKIYIKKGKKRKNYQKLRFDQLKNYIQATKH